MVQPKSAILVLFNDQGSMHLLAGTNLRNGPMHQACGAGESR
jgi:hypothetical protein